MVEPPHNFGLREFIEIYGCRVTEKYANGMTVLHAMPTRQPTLEGMPYMGLYKNGIDIVLSGGQIVGAKIELDTSFLATIASDGIKSYFLDKPGIYQKLGVGRSTMIWGGFKDFLLNAFRSFNPTSGNDVWLRYIREGNLFVPFYVVFDNFEIRAREVFLPFEHEKGGCTYSLYSPSIGPENLLIASKEDENNRIEASFPESISEEEVSELERVLMTDTEWTNLPRDMPILRYLRIPKS